MRQALVTLAIGNEYERMAYLTHPTMVDYASRIKAEFIIISTNKYGHKAQWEKFQLGNLLEYFDRIIYLDTDIIVTKDCRSLFDIVPETDFGAFIESKLFPYSKDADHQERIVNIQKEVGYIGWNYQYFNAGVMVISKKHRPIFNPSTITYEDDLVDQTLINYNVKTAGFWVHDIGIRYNKTDLVNLNDRFDSFVIHYAGKGYTNQRNNNEARIERITKDIEMLKSIGKL